MRSVYNMENSLEIAVLHCKLFNTFHPLSFPPPLPPSPKKGFVLLIKLNQLCLDGSPKQSDQTVWLFSLCFPLPSGLSFLDFFLFLSYYYNHCWTLYQESYFREAKEGKQQSYVCSPTMQLLTFLSNIKANQTRNQLSWENLEFWISP